MADKKHIDILSKGVETWNKWRQENPAIIPKLDSAHLMNLDLRGCNLTGAHLRLAHLMRANLADADLSGADLFKADLMAVTLVGAKLNWADLVRADFAFADMRRVDLREARIVGTLLNQADLRRSNLEHAFLDEAVLVNVDLTGALGLDSCVHEGPSTIDHRTLLKSGMLPQIFLRGCGLPDSLMEYLPSLLNEPIQFYSCYISYSSIDENFAMRLHADLQNRGIRCWFAPKDIQGGKKTHEQIDQAIRTYDRLLLVLSEHSMKSQWVEFEIRKARKQEVQKNKRVLFPIRLVRYKTLKKWECFDADTKKDLATEIREYYIPDFSNWKTPDIYQKAFDRLLRDLEAEKSTT